MLLPRIVINPSFSQLADVIACVVVDVNHLFNRCYLSSGRWNSHFLQQVADVIAKWQML